MMCKNCEHVEKLGIQTNGGFRKKMYCIKGRKAFVGWEDSLKKQPEDCPLLPESKEK
jgi:hypothetical protein